MKKISILFLILLCNCTFLYAQQFSITGVVTDKKLKEPIIGASVIVKGTTNGTVTDLDGNFTIQVSKENVLVISFIGYTTQEIKVNENQFSYNIQMSEKKMHRQSYLSIFAIDFYQYYLLRVSIGSFAVYK